MFPSVLLPITLTALEGINEGGHNTITWITNSEINNDYFSLERSINGNDWEVIGIIEGAGTTQEAHFYAFRDENPYLPISYYRLAQTDYDGTATRSHVIAVNANTSDEIISGVFPNPAVTSASFAYRGTSQEPLNLSIVNSFGEIVGMTTYSDLNKDETITFELEDYSAGVYQVFFEQGNWRYIEKLTLIK